MTDHGPLTELQAHAQEVISATPIIPGKWWMPRQQGCTRIPMRDPGMDGRGGIGLPEVDRHTCHPCDYGRYIPIDLDENNRHSRAAWSERNGGKQPPAFGWGVCRGGFGLQNHHGIMSRDQAEAWSTSLNIDNVGPDAYARNPEPFDARDTATFDNLPTLEQNA